MSVVICFANMKGGVGKTTLCVHLAFELFREEKNVLLVDNDPQFNATSSLLNPKLYIDRIITKRTFHTIYEIYEKPPRIRGSRTEKRDPKKFFFTRWYIGEDKRFVLDLLPSRIELYETLRNPSQKEYLLHNFLKRHATKYDYILIDCPPTPSVLNLSAFAASDYVLIPVTPNYYATMGLPQFLGTLKDFKEDLIDQHNITPLGVIFTNVERVITQDTQRAIDRVKTALLESKENIPVFTNKMSHYKVYEKALWQSLPVQMISGRGIRGKGPAMAELRAIAVELQDKANSRNKEAASNG